jgi:hypothetical protein
MGMRNKGKDVIAVKAAIKNHNKNNLKKRVECEIISH